MKYPIFKRLHRILFQGPLHMFSSVAIIISTSEVTEWFTGRLFFSSIPLSVLLALVALIGGGFLSDYIMSAFEDTSTFADDIHNDDLTDTECE